MTELPEAYWPNMFIDEGEVDVDGFFSTTDDDGGSSASFNPYVCQHDRPHPYETYCWLCWKRPSEKCVHNQIGLCHTCFTALRKRPG